MSGSTIGGVVGGVIGFYVGGPAGAQWGWMIGSAVGGYVDPDVIKGPRLTDPQQQTAAEGVPIPLIYAMGGVLGTIIQCQSTPTEHKHKESTGKGGPVQETYTYTRTVAIAICQAAPLGGENMLRRAWVNGKLAYDATGAGKIDSESAKFLDNMRFYSGSETQTPDAYLEALPSGDGGGVGNVPAYRGTCYAVLPDCDVTQGGGAVPTIKWEIVSHGTETVVEGTAPLWIASNGGGKLLLSNGKNWTANPTFSVGGQKCRLTYADGTLASAFNGDVSYSADRGVNWSASSVDVGSGPASPSGSRMQAINGKFYFPSNPFALTKIMEGDGTAYESKTGDPTLAYATLCVAGTNTFQVAGCQSGRVAISFDKFTSATLSTQFGNDVTCAASDGASVVLCALDSVKSTSDGINFSSAASLSGFGNASCIAAGDDGATWVIGGTMGIGVSIDGCASVTAVTLPSTFQAFDVRFGDGRFVATGTDGSSSEPIILTALQADPFTWFLCANNFTHGETVVSVEYMGCGDGFTIPDAPGMIVHRDGSVCMDYESHTVTPDGLDLADVQGDLIARAFINDYDVSALAGTTVTGYTISQPTPSGAASQELQKVYFYDLPEWGNSGDDYVKLRAVPRGGANVFSITDDDLVDVDSDEDTRAQQVELARVINVVASDPDHAYEPIKQTSERYSENVKSESEVTFSTAALFDRDQLSQRADIFHKIQEAESNGTIIRTLPEEFTAYVPSDCGTVNGKRYRIQRIDQQDGTVQVEMVRDRPSAYTSSATGSTGVTVPDPVSFILGPTIFQALNLPRLTSADSSPGMYIFVSGLFPAWAGCDLYLSVDGGTTEQKVATILNPATMGWLTAPLAAGGGTLSVQLYNDDELDDATDDQLSARFNACAVTTNGVSEILQFKDATDTGTKTYDLTTLYRAELGTTEDDHFADDDFAMLDGSQAFLPLDASLVGKELIFRPVTRGTVPANNSTYTVTFDPHFTGPEVLEYLLDESGNKLLDEDGGYLLQE